MKKHNPLLPSIWRRRKVLLVLLACLAFGVIGAVVMSITQAAEIETEFQVHCSGHHANKDDPIVLPGQVGASHMHQFHGNTTTNAFSTFESLMAAGEAACAGEMGNVDKSAYWVPSIYKNNPDGTQTMVPARNATTFIYYERAGGRRGPKVVPFPNGLRMVTGDSKATAPQSSKIARWACGGGGGGTQYNYLPDCSNSSSGKNPHLVVAFPSCWDGKNLDSADHKSHMAFVGTGSVCPSTHPVAVPQIEMEILYEGITGGPSYVLSSGGQYSAHGDFFAAWDVRAQNALVQECLNLVGNIADSCVGMFWNGNSIDVGGQPSVSDFKRIDLTKYSYTPITPTPPVTPTPTPTPTPPATPVVGDINKDGRINALDLSILMSHDGGIYPAADLNGDGTVGAADLAILLSKWSW